MEVERREAKPEILLTVRDSDGNVVRRISGPTGKGIHRVAWDLRFPSGRAIDVDPAERPTEDDQPTGFLAAPGTYTVELSQRVNGVSTALADPQTFQVERLRSGALPGAEPAEAAAFWQELAAFQRRVSAADQVVVELQGRLELLKQAIDRARAAPGELDDQWQQLRTEVFEIEELLSGNQALAALGTAAPASIRQRLGRVLVGTSNSTYGPTKTHRDVLGYAQADYRGVVGRLTRLQKESFPALEAALQQAGAPWTPGAALPQE